VSDKSPVQVAYETAAAESGGAWLPWDELDAVEQQAARIFAETASKPVEQQRDKYQADYERGCATCVRDIANGIEAGA
jgi:hypothetical protein